MARQQFTWPDDTLKKSKLSQQPVDAIMIVERKIETPQLILAPLSIDHASGPYLEWMNNPEVVRFLESRFQHFERADLELFIENCNRSSSIILLGMFDRRDGTHVGNIKLGPIDGRHRRGEIGLIVGDKSKWGRGLAREAIAATAEFAFSELNLAKLTAGCYASHIGSIRAFLAAGWHEEARRTRHVLLDGQWEDVILLARFGDHDSSRGGFRLPS